MKAVGGPSGFGQPKADVPTILLTAPSRRVKALWRVASTPRITNPLMAQTSWNINWDVPNTPAPRRNPSHPLQTARRHSPIHDIIPQTWISSWRDTSADPFLLNSYSIWLRRNPGNSIQLFSITARQGTLARRVHPAHYKPPHGPTSWNINWDVPNTPAPRRNPLSSATNRTSALPHPRHPSLKPGSPHGATLQPTHFYSTPIQFGSVGTPETPFNYSPPRKRKRVEVDENTPASLASEISGPSAKHQKRASPRAKLVKKSYSDFRLTTKDWDHLTKMHEVLQEPANIQQSFSSSKYPTVWRTLPLLEALRETWTNMAATEKFQGMRESINAGLDNLEKWYTKTDDTDVYFVCLGESVIMEFFAYEEGLAKFEAVFDAYYVEPADGVAEAVLPHNVPTGPVQYGYSWMELRLKRARPKISKGLIRGTS
ncbi:hypothetical protein B0H10DRAFT_2249520 [Mycena sp. CBHHK59/15]|nr:hypothetical protein B0H10DRAFT_2249520 [Mycena sp. CBHHK59/15]